MGNSLVFERFQWLDVQVRGGRYPNAVFLARKFEISSKTAQRNMVCLFFRFDANFAFFCLIQNLQTGP